MIKEGLRSHLSAHCCEQELRSWFDPLLVDSLPKGGVSVTFPHCLFSAWIGNDKLLLLEQTIQKAFGCKVIFRERSRRRRASIPGELGEAASPSAESRRYSFEGFLYNRKNEFPVAMARELGARPYPTAHTPFVICGKGVCGKTHLLRAMAYSAGCVLGNERIHLADIASLLSLGVGGLEKKSAAVDALFIDDGQEITKYASLQHELARTIDKFCGEKKALVLAFDDALPHVGLHPKLRSRLESGLIISLKKPDLDIRLRFVRDEALGKNLSLNREQALLLARHIDDPRLLSGILAKAAAYNARRTSPLSSNDLETLMESVGALKRSPLNAEAIVNAVAERFGVSPKDIAGPERGRDLVQARQISMYLCRELLGLSFPAIGAVFGGKNHATVVYACKKIKELQESDSNMNKVVSSMRKKCLSLTTP